MHWALAIERARKGDSTLTAEDCLGLASVSKSQLKDFRKKPQVSTQTHGKNRLVKRARKRWRIAKWTLTEVDTHLTLDYVKRVLPDLLAKETKEGLMVEPEKISPTFVEYVREQAKTNLMKERRRPIIDSPVTDEALREHADALNNIPC